MEILLSIHLLALPQKNPVFLLKNSDTTTLPLAIFLTWHLSPTENRNVRQDSGRTTNRSVWSDWCEPLSMAVRTGLKSLNTWKWQKNFWKNVLNVTGISTGSVNGLIIMWCILYHSYRWWNWYDRICDYIEILYVFNLKKRSNEIDIAT